MTKVTSLRRTMKMKNQNFPFFLAVHAVFSRYGQFLKQTVDPAFQELRQEFPSTSRAVMIVRRPAGN